MAENIATAIRGDRGLTTRGEMSKLSAEAQRLGRSLAVVEKPIAAADASIGETGRLWHHAVTMRDQIEEELSRVCFWMEVRGFSRDAAAAPEDVIGRAVLTDTLLEAYCVLRDAPEEVVGEKRRRYAMMRALMVAQDATSAEAERLEPGE
jgi:hypothetical protein